MNDRNVPGEVGSNFQKGQGGILSQGGHPFRGKRGKPVGKENLIHLTNPEKNLKRTLKVREKKEHQTKRKREKAKDLFTKATDDPENSVRELIEKIEGTTALRWPRGRKIKTSHTEKKERFPKGNIGKKGGGD